MSERQDQLKSLMLHPGWKLCINYILSSQAIKFNEVSKLGATTEDICKSVGGIDALKRFVGWVEASAMQEDATS